MSVKLNRIVSILKKLFQLLLIFVCGYFIILVLAILWTFEVKLYRWPIFIYSAPFSFQVGDDINRIRLFERLGRQGYLESVVPVPEPGEWSRSGSGITIFLKSSPFAGEEIASGPVSLTLDWDRITSIRLMRSLQEVNRITLEPELIYVISASGFSQELCRPVSLEEIPPMLVDAILLTEDSRFFSHSGIDIDSIRQAFMTNIKAWRYVQGGSTIPQQLIRMVMLSPEKTLGRKINEVFLALTADALYRKETILQAYLNRLYFGQWGPYPIKGISEAARHFFGKALGELDPAECALLAAMIRAPSVINPYRHPERALARRNMVLALLFKAGKITRETYDEAIVRPVIMRKPGQTQVKASMFVDLVRDGLPAQIPGAGPKNLRQDVLTSLDALIQSDSERLLRPLGEASYQTHFLLTEPRSGEIKAFIAPSGETRWSGGGTNVETVLPFIIAPALVPEDPAHPKYTLTSTFFVSSRPGGLVTFREAYRNDRSILLRNLIDSAGTDKLVQTLREFGAPVRKAPGGGIIMDTVYPLDLAQSYALMATLGNAGKINPGVRIPNLTLPVDVSGKKSISVRLAAIYMTNHLMKLSDVRSVERSPSDNIKQLPSFFITRDDQGIWGVAYRNDALLIIRLPGNPLNDARLTKLMSRLLPAPGHAQDSGGSIPEGLVFRNICIESGLLSTSTCPNTVKEPFFKGTQPVEWCPYRHDPTPARPVNSQSKKP
ncbi:MAG: transglycosylase domain-containing protein [Desulfomonilaceae bacterium]